MLNSVTLLGSSSGRNAGDASLISGIMESVDTVCGRRLTYEIPTIRPSYITDHYPNRTRPISMMPWSFSIKMLGLPTFRSILRTDLTLIFDAILFDRSLYNPLFNFMSSLYLMLPAARRKGKRMACFNVGVGPVNTAHGRRMLRCIADMMDFITVRDEASFAILREVGASNANVLVTADAALNVQASGEEKANTILGDLGFDVDREILGININAYLDTWAGPHVTPMGKEAFLGVYTKALNRVLEQLDVQVLFVCTQHLDVSITRELMARIKPRRHQALLSNAEHNHYEVKAALGKLSLLAGMRLHCMILSSSELTPVIGLAYQPKIHHYYETLGLSEYSLDFADFSEEALTRHLLNGWEHRADIRRRLGKRIPELKREAWKAADLVGALNRDEDIGRTVAALRNA